jgi:hypothetical protein
MFSYPCLYISEIVLIGKFNGVWHVRIMKLERRHGKRNAEKKV